MSLAILGVLRVVFVVACYERCRGFYERRLGLRVDCEWDRGPGDRGVVYELGSVHLELLEGPHDPALDGFYLYIPVEDVDALWARLSGAAEVVAPIATQPWGHRNFAILDPSGAKLKFFSEV